MSTTETIHTRPMKPWEREGVTEAQYYRAEADRLRENLRIATEALEAIEAGDVYGPAVCHTSKTRARDALRRIRGEG